MWQIEYTAGTLTVDVAIKKNKKINWHLKNAMLASK